MEIIIEGTNIKDEGGGFIHLQNLLNFYTKIKKIKIILYSSNTTLNKIPNYSFLEKKPTNKIISDNFIFKIIWQNFFLNKKKIKNSNLLLVLGGIYLGNFKPTIVICQNLLPFSNDQYSKYTFFHKLKLYIQCIFYTRSFNKSSGIIYLTDSSRKIINRNNIISNFNFKIINHGINSQEKIKRSFDNFNNNKPLKLLYVSRYEPYKNHYKLLKCLNMLIKLGYNIQLTLIFSENNLAFKNIKQELKSKIYHNDKIIFKNNLNNISLSKEYKNADCFIFPSECETFGIPLIEAASFSLPIACTNYIVFKEILGDSGDYFDINDIESIKKVIINFYENINYLKKKSSKVYEISKNFSWKNSMLEYHNYFKEMINNEKN